MLKYNFLGNSVISVDLKNGYSVIAISKWNKDEEIYRTSLYLKGDTYDILELIEEKENIKIYSDKKSLFVNLSKIITGYFVNGFFNKYIARYEYMMECFNKGNEFFETYGGTND